MTWPADLNVADLLKGLVAAGHRTLVFRSQSRVMLDILQVSGGVLEHHRLNVCLSLSCS
jgi:hypothetical protein